jgi:hypothetical protein
MTKEIPMPPDYQGLLAQHAKARQQYREDSGLVSTTALRATALELAIMRCSPRHRTALDAIEEAGRVEQQQVTAA